MTAGPEAAAVRAEAPPAVFRRILLKLSGEALMGSYDFGIDHATTQQMAAEIVDVHRQGVQIAIVVGGGNIYRGMAAAAARPR